MRFVFVNVRLDLYPPLGLCYLSSYLKQHIPRIETVLIEPVTAADTKGALERILGAAPDMVGFTTYSVSCHEVYRLCRKLKESRPEIPIVLGGPHITSLPRSLPEEADLGVLGEGEDTLRDLVGLWLERGSLDEKELAKIPGLCYRDQGAVCVTAPRPVVGQLDSIPEPDLDLLNMRYYTARKRFLVLDGYFRGFTLLSSRGCHYRCRFCQASAHWGKCRYHSAQRVVHEIETLKTRFPGLNAINVVDDLFIGNKRRLKEIAGMIREKKLHEEIAFNVNGHVKMIRDDVLEVLESMNVIQIGFGFESGSERILDFLKKGSVKVRDNDLAARLTREHGIGVGGQFMIGCPGEEEADIEATIDFINKTPMSHAHLSVTTPLPGTELWEICKEKGLVSDDMDWRKLDFGNPGNPDLVYCNEDGIGKERFAGLKEKAQRACDQWNPRPSRLNDILLEYSAAKVFGHRGFARMMFLRLLRFPRFLVRAVFKAVMVHQEEN